MRLTEERLKFELMKHMGNCDDCQAGEDCDTPDRIEASFWNEVDNRIDDDRVKKSERWSSD